MWNYRVMCSGKGTVDECYTIHEVYYDETGKQVQQWTEEAVPAYGESLEELVETLQRMLKAATKPVLENK